MAVDTKQMMDVRAGKGMSMGQSSEHLRHWGQKAWVMALDTGKYDPSRTGLNFEIIRGGKIVPVQKLWSIPERIKQNLAERGVVDPNVVRVEKYENLMRKYNALKTKYECDGKRDEKLAKRLLKMETQLEKWREPRCRTVVNFLFGGNRERMHEIAFGEQKVDLENKENNVGIKRTPDIERWAKDIYNFVSGKYGEENIAAFVVHLDETTPHIHCTLLPIRNGKVAFKDIFGGRGKDDMRRYMIALHNELAAVNKPWGLVRGTSIKESGAKHRTTEQYRRELSQICTSLEDKIEVYTNVLRGLEREIAIKEKALKRSL